MNYLRICFSVVFIQVIFVFSSLAQRPNTLSNEEKQAGWKILFDGETFNGWQTLGKNGWAIKNAELTAITSSAPRQLDIITKDQYDNFELAFEFKVSENSNSGLKYLVSNNFPEQKDVYLGLEYQILDDINFKYPERGELRTSSSLYDLIAADTTKRNAPLGSWNSARIVVNRNLIQHWLNGYKVLEYDRDSEGFAILISKSKYKNLSGFGKAQKGHILLQNEGSPVSFRNIKVKSMQPDDKDRR